MEPAHPLVRRCDVANGEMVPDSIGDATMLCLSYWNHTGQCLRREVNGRFNLQALKV